MSVRGYVAKQVHGVNLKLEQHGLTIGRDPCRTYSRELLKMPSSAISRSLSTMLQVKESL